MLSLKQRISLRLLGYTYLKHEKRPGWNGELPIYLVRCPKHGVFEDYPHGFDGHFHCPKCVEEQYAEIWAKENKK